MRDGEDLPVALGLGDRLDEEIDRFGLRLVRAHTGEPHERPRALPTGSKLCNHVVELRLRPRRVPGLEVQIGGVNRSATRLVGPVGRRQPTRAVEQQRGRPRGTPRPSVMSRLFQRRGDSLVRLLDRGSQLPCTRLRIFEERSKPDVNLDPPRGIGRFVRRGGKQRVREANPIAVELDDPRLERGSKPALRPTPDAASVRPVVGCA